MFSLRRSDVDTDTRRITIRESKTDHLTGREGRIIVMPMLVEHLLGAMFWELAIFNDYDRIFPLTEDGNDPVHAFEQVFDDIVKRAGLSNFIFKGLRKTAGTRFFQAGLEEPERDLQMGHEPKTVEGKHYLDEDTLRENIQRKLDSYSANQGEHKIFFDYLEAIGPARVRNESSALTFWWE